MSTSQAAPPTEHKLNDGEEDAFRELVPWQQMQYKSMRGWCNTYLPPSQRVKILTTAFQDGIVLARLLKSLSGNSVPGVQKQAKMKIQKINNLYQCFTFMKAQKIGIENISAEDIEKGNLKLILAMIWNLVVFYQFHGHAKERLLERLNNFLNDKDVVGGGTYGKDVTNFDQDFQDGKAFVYIVRKYRPDLLKKKILKNKNMEEVLTMVFDVLDQEFNVPPLISPQDMQQADIDEKSVMTYVALCLDSVCRPIRDQSPVITVDEQFNTYIDSLTGKSPSDISIGQAAFLLDASISAMRTRVRKNAEISAESEQPQPRSKKPALLTTEMPVGLQELIALRQRLIDANSPEVLAEMQPQLKETYRKAVTGVAVKKSKARNIQPMSGDEQAAAEAAVNVWAEQQLHRLKKKEQDDEEKEAGKGNLGWYANETEFVLESIMSLTSSKKKFCVNKFDVEWFRLMVETAIKSLRKLIQRKIDKAAKSEKSKDEVLVDDLYYASGKLIESSAQLFGSLDQMESQSNRTMMANVHQCLGRVYDSASDLFDTLFGKNADKDWGNELLKGLDFADEPDNDDPDADQEKQAEVFYEAAGQTDAALNSMDSKLEGEIDPDTFDDSQFKVEIQRFMDSGKKTASYLNKKQKLYGAKVVDQMKKFVHSSVDMFSALNNARKKKGVAQVAAKVSDKARSVRDGINSLMTTLKEAVEAEKQRIIAWKENRKPKEWQGLLGDVVTTLVDLTELVNMRYEQGVDHIVGAQKAIKGGKSDSSSSSSSASSSASTSTSTSTSKSASSPSGSASMTSSSSGGASAPASSSSMADLLRTSGGNTMTAAANKEKSEDSKSNWMLRGKEIRSLQELLVGEVHKQQMAKFKLDDDRELDEKNYSNRAEKKQEAQLKFYRKQEKKLSHKEQKMRKKRLQRLKLATNVCELRLTEKLMEEPVVVVDTGGSGDDGSRHWAMDPLWFIMVVKGLVKSAQELFYETTDENIWQKITEHAYSLEHSVVKIADLLRDAPDEVSEEKYKNLREKVIEDVLGMTEYMKAVWENRHGDRSITCPSLSDLTDKLAALEKTFSSTKGSDGNGKAEEGDGNNSPKGTSKSASTGSPSKNKKATKESHDALFAASGNHALLHKNSTVSSSPKLNKSNRKKSKVLRRNLLAIYQAEMHRLKLEEEQLEREKLEESRDKKAREYEDKAFTDKESREKDRMKEQSKRTEKIILILRDLANCIRTQLQARLWQPHIQSNKWTIDLPWVIQMCKELVGIADETIHQLRFEFGMSETDTWPVVETATKDTLPNGEPEGSTIIRRPDTPEEKEARIIKLSHHLQDETAFLVKFVLDTPPSNKEASKKFGGARKRVLDAINQLVVAMKSSWDTQAKTRDLSFELVLPPSDESVVKSPKSARERAKTFRSELKRSISPRTSSSREH